jgi:hypothetical protein
MNKEMGSEERIHEERAENTIRTHQKRGKQ